MLLLAVFLFALPAGAAGGRFQPAADLPPVPDLETRGRIICEQTAARIDAAQRRGEKPAGHDEARYDHCLRSFECGKVYWARERGQLPEEARTSRLGMMKLLSRVCVTKP